MCYYRCRYEGSHTGECNNPSRYKYMEDAACFEYEDEFEEEGDSEDGEED